MRLAESKSSTPDRFQRLLEQKLEQLRECQRKSGVKSCLACSKIIGCALRNEYVNAVYLSMNKGQGGGFEF